MEPKAVADRVHPDEPCYGLLEAPMLVPMPGGSRQWRWCQHLRVVRGDRLAYHVIDYGPAEEFEDVTPLLMPSFGDDTVAQLQEHAEKNREDDHWVKRRRELLEGSTLIADAIRYHEIRLENLANRSVIGPAIAVQRNGMARDAALRVLKERRDARRGYTQH